MTNRDVAVLAFKLAGLWLMATAAIGVAGIPYYWDPRFEDVRAMTVFFTLLPVLVAVGIGVPVWFSAEWLASRIFPEVSPEPMRFDRLRGEPLFALALSIIGVFFVCEALPVVVNGIALFLRSRHISHTVLGEDISRQGLLWNEAAKANAAAGVARLAIGAALLAGPAKLSAALARVRREFQGSLTEEDGRDRGDGGVEQADAVDGAGQTERRH